MMRGVFIAAAVAAFALVGVLRAAGPATALEGGILAKHKAYAGWAYGDGTLKSARLTVVADRPSPKPDATPDPLGEANRTTVEVRRELLYRATTTAYGVNVDANGFTGSVFWRANVNGHTVTRRGRDAREALTQDLIDAEALAEVPSTQRPDSNFDGKAADVLRVLPKTGSPADVYFDRSDGALLGYTIDPDVPSDAYTAHVVSYAEFAPGKRYVSAIRYGESKRIVRITKFEPNVEVSDADLHPPTPTSTWTFGQPSSVPIEIVEHANGYTNTGARAVHVDVTINGHLGHFLFDSGASGIFVFNSFARSAQLVDIGRSSFTGVNGRSVSSTLARADTLRIGGNTLHNVIVERSTTDGSTFDGLIGFDVLAGAVVDVDLPKHELTISDPAVTTAQAGPGAYAFQPDLSSFLSGVPVKVQDHVLPSVWLDTGNDFFVILPHDLERKTVALPNEITIGSQRIEDKAVFGGADGSGDEIANCVRLNEIQIGPYRYQKAKSCFAPNDAFGTDGGLIGFDFLRHFNWTFDYPHGRVVLTPNGQ